MTTAHHPGSPAHLAVLRHAQVLAGSDYRWNHADAPSVLRSDYMRGLTWSLVEQQRGLCVGCGRGLLDTGEGVEYLHLVSAPKRRGVLPGLGYAGCRSCNLYDLSLTLNAGGVIPLSSLARLDLLPMMHVPKREWLTIAAAHGPLPKPAHGTRADSHVVTPFRGSPASHRIAS